MHESSTKDDKHSPNKIQVKLKQQEALSNVTLPKLITKATKNAYSIKVKSRLSELHQRWLNQSLPQQVKEKFSSVIK